MKKLFIHILKIQSMKSFDIIPKAPQVRLKRNNTTAIRCTLCYAAVVLGIVALLLGCPDSTGDGNGDSNGDNNGDAIGTPTEDTLVQSAASGAISVDTITLTWALPTDTDGYLGVTISEENDSGSLSDSVDIDAETTTYTVTNLAADTEYTFTITTRYTASGKNNSIMVTETTAKATGVQSVALDTSATTSDSVTITWQDPADADDYTGVTITADPAIGSLSTETVAVGTNTLTINELTAGTEHTLTLSFTTQYSTAGKGSDSDHIIMVMTQSNVVTNVTASDITANSLTLSWTDPEDTTGYSGVMISANPAEGSLTSPNTVAEGTTPQQLIVTGLNTRQEYTFTLTTQYADGKAGDDTIFMTRTPNSIDLDGDGLIDISSLERLDNVRYNLDLGAASDDGRYKESDQTGDNDGVLCGDDGTTPCTGYELTRSLDFNDGGSYESGSIQNKWRPNAATDSTGMVLTQANANNGINAGWDPIGDCNTDISDSGTFSCGDANDTPFAARFEGNGYTISNLYARNTTSNDGSAIGLFGLTAVTATIRSLGVQDVALYGGRNGDRVGSIVGDHGGTIVGSYASGGSVTGNDTGSNDIGGLVGDIGGTIIASYTAVAVSTTSNTNGNSVGGLVGTTASDSTVIASYASDTVNGSSNASGENVGGLVGNTSVSVVVIASYASGAVNGGDGGSLDFVGAFVGGGGSRITATYATGSVNGGNSASHSGALRAVGGPGNTKFSYGFGIVTNDGGGGYDGTDKPTVDGTEDTAVITMAAQLTLANAGAIWNSAADDTLNAWDFGDSDQDPALRYADYDGTDTDYGCTDANNPTSTATFVIPPVVAAPGGPLEIVCGETLLPGQRP